MGAFGIRFGLPPSLGSKEAVSRAEILAGHFKHQIEAVKVASSYEQLANDVLSGQLDAAWAPPFVCAKLEAMGAPIALRSIRHGRASYRAALVTRPETHFNVENLFSIRAVWSDQDSVAGYLLPISYLKSLKVDIKTAFKSQRFVGSFMEAVGDVLKGEADVTSVFAPLHDSLAGLDEILPGSRQNLKSVGVTDEAPNDGVAFSLSLKKERLEAFVERFLSLHKSPEGQKVLREVFFAERFEPSPRLSYKALYPVAFGRG